MDGSNRTTQFRVSLTAENSEARLRLCLCQQADEFRKVGHWPAFVWPAGSRLERDPARSRWSPFVLHRGGCCGPFGQPGEIPVNGNAEQWKHAQIPIDRVRVRRGARHNDVIETARSFARIIQPDC